MRCLLIYFTGTFNTRYVSQQLKQKLELVGYDVDLYEIDPLNTERLDLSGYDLIGLGYPIYGYNAPWPFLKFIRKQKFPKGIRRSSTKTPARPRRSTTPPRCSSGASSSAARLSSRTNIIL